MSRKKPSKNRKEKCRSVKRKKIEKKTTKESHSRKKSKPNKNENKCPPIEKKPSNQSVKNPKCTSENNGKKPAQVQKKSLMVRRHQQFHQQFLSYDEIIAFCEKTKRENGLKVDLVKIGDSTQGKPILMVIVAGTPTKEDKDTPKMGVMIEAGLNGSNYMAISNTLFIIDYLVKNQNCARLVDYYIIPCSNPDGYTQFLDSQKEEKGGENGNNRDQCKPDSGNRENDEQPVQMDLTNNFPVLLGLNDMKHIDTQNFLEKIRIWKEKYTSHCPEQLSVLRAIYAYQFALKMLISLQEGGESICYPFGFCNDQSIDVNDLASVAKKARCVMNCRNFEYGSIYDLQGLTYGSLIDFLKIEKLPIPFLYTIQVNKPHRKSKDVKTQFKNDVRKIVQNGSEIMSCVKAMTCAIYKFYNKISDKSVVESTTKLNKNIY